MKCLLWIYFLMFFCGNKPTSLNTLGRQTKIKPESFLAAICCSKLFFNTQKKKNKSKEHTPMSPSFLLCLLSLDKNSAFGMQLKTTIFCKDSAYILNN